MRCYACNGSKKLMGMGMITKDCYVCDGVGYIKPKAELAERAEPIPIEIIAVCSPTTTHPIDKRSKAWRERHRLAT